MAPVTKNSSGEEQMNVAAFAGLLRDPIVTSKLPEGFDVDQEAVHLAGLWDTVPQLRSYTFHRFVHAGGSGMVFEVTQDKRAEPLALKVARVALIAKAHDAIGVATNLSPVKESELQALKSLHHRHIVRFHEAIGGAHGVIAVATSYVVDPKPIDEFLKAVLAKNPDQRKYPGMGPLSPQRLDNACHFLLQRVEEIASALAYMHERGVYHFDVKPANILVGKNGLAILTDLGSCIDSSLVDVSKPFRAHFTWTYAHPLLASTVNDPGSMSGGGLKSSANVPVGVSIQNYDLFALGRTLQETLALLVSEFGERCYSSYAFRYVHLLAGLLLDGQNTPAEESEWTIPKATHGHSFVTDVAMRYPVRFFKAYAFRSAADLENALLRYHRNWSPRVLAPELDPWPPDVINDGYQRTTPFTRRVAELLNHPAMRRLKGELALGWMREIYPNATHNRWAHTIGVYSRVIDSYRALLSDPDVPTVRILLQPADVSHALAAALLHDLAQSAFAHDFEAASDALYVHEDLIERLLDERYWSPTTLRRVLATHWNDVNVNRVIAILDANRRSPQKYKHMLEPVDGLAADLLNGPIDADKTDYVRRDTEGCGVPYGKGADLERLQRALTTTVVVTGERVHLALAFKAKGTAAVESLLLARYQMYIAVYWQHAYRCFQSMFVQTTSDVFGELQADKRVLLQGKQVNLGDVSQLIYNRLVCGRKRAEIKKLQLKGIPDVFFDDANGPPPSVKQERALHLLWSYADAGNRKLIERLSERRLFKRVFEVRLGDLTPVPEYAAVAAQLTPKNRPQMARRLRELFLAAVHKEMAKKGPTASIAEDAAKSMHEALLKEVMPLVVLDFPTRGIPNEANYPTEIGDASRKYLYAPGVKSNVGAQVFDTIRTMLIRKATISVYAADELHQLITRYLSAEKVRACVGEVVPSVLG